MWLGPGYYYPLHAQTPPLARQASYPPDSVLSEESFSGARRMSLRVVACCKCPRWQQDRNLTAHPQCRLLFVDPDNPYRYREMRGRVVDEREEGARSHIDDVAKKYMGKDEYPYYGGETRAMYLVDPTRFACTGDGRAAVCCLVGI